MNDEHYKGSTIEPIEAMQANLSPEAFQGFLRGNIIKYACRMGKKDSEVTEARKIAVYASWLYLSVQGKRICPKDEGRTIEDK